MFTMELARRLADTNITVNCLDPGFNVTGLGRELRFAGALERVLKALRIGDPHRGADLIVALATEPQYAQETGLYVTARGHQRITPTPPGDDPLMQRRLWHDTTALLAGRHGNPA